MGSSISVWHWVVVLLIIGVPVCLIIWGSKRKTSSDNALVGFGGWLLLLAIWQTLSPLRTLTELSRSTETYQDVMGLPNGPVVVYGEAGLMLAFAVLQFATAVLMYRKSPLFRQFFVFQWLSVAATAILDVLLISIAL